MGGTTPLGYVTKERTLALHAEGAETVRTLFKLYLELGSVAALRAEAERRGLRSRQGRPLHHGALYFLLQNPVYRGLIRHRSATYPSLHPAIIDPESWDGVQAKLARNRQIRREGGNAKEPSLLAGRLYADGPHPIIPSHAVKKGRRHRYYIERQDPSAAAAGRRPRRRRFPASEIEDLVVDAIAKMLRGPGRLATVPDVNGFSASAMAALVASAKDVADGLERDPREAHRLIRCVVRGVDVESDQVCVAVARSALAKALGLSARRAEMDDVHRLIIPAMPKARGVELRFVLPPGDGTRKPTPDAALIGAVVRGHDWFRRLMAPARPSMGQIAAADGVTPAHFRRLLDLAFLAPDITAAILDGRQPPDLSAERITRLDDLPLDWAEQRRLLGFV